MGETFSPSTSIHLLIKTCPAFGRRGYMSRFRTSLLVPSAVAARQGMEHRDREALPVANVSKKVLELFSKLESQQY